MCEGSSSTGDRPCSPSARTRAAWSPVTKPITTVRRLAMPAISGVSFSKRRRFALRVQLLRPTSSVDPILAVLAAQARPGRAVCPRSCATRLDQRFWHLVAASTWTRAEPLGVAILCHLQPLSPFHDTTARGGASRDRVVMPYPPNEVDAQSAATRSSRSTCPPFATHTSMVRGCPCFGYIDLLIIGAWTSDAGAVKSNCECWKSLPA